MIFSGFGEFYEGYNRAEDRWQARRANARRAFIEFQQQFPNAGYEEFRRMADDLSDGSNYLRGSMPSDQMLRQLSQQRQEQFAQEQMGKRLELLNRQAQVAGQMDALAGQAALDITDDNKLLEAVATQLGYDPKNPGTSPILETVKTRYPQGFGGIRQRAEQEFVTKAMPTVTDLIKSNPNLTDEQVYQLVPGLSGQNGQLSSGRKKAVGALLQNAREQVQRVRDQELFDQSRTILSDASTAIRNGLQWTMPAGIPPEVQARLAPQIEAMKKGFDSERDRTRSIEGEVAVASRLASLSQIKGIHTVWANDPAVRSQTERELAQVYRNTTGKDAPPQLISGMVEQYVRGAGAVATAEVREREKTQIDTYRRDLEARLSDPNGDVASFFPPAGITNQDILATAESAYAEAVQRRKRSEAQQGQQAANSVNLSETEVQNLIATGATRDQVRAEVQRRAQAANLGRPVDAAAIDSQTDILMGAISSQRSGTLTRTFQETEASQTALSQEQTKTNLQGFNGMVDGLFGKDSKEASDWKNVANALLFGPGGAPATPENLAIVEGAMRDSDFNGKYASAAEKAAALRTSMRSMSSADRAGAARDVLASRGVPLSRPGSLDEGIRVYANEAYASADANFTEFAEVDREFENGNLDLMTYQAALAELRKDITATYNEQVNRAVLSIRNPAWSTGEGRVEAERIMSSLNEDYKSIVAMIDEKASQAQTISVSRNSEASERSRQEMPTNSGRSWQAPTSAVTGVGSGFRQGAPPAPPPAPLNSGRSWRSNSGR